MVEKRASYIRNEMLDYLDELRESGVCNMWGATTYLENEYPKISHPEASSILSYWMKTFGKENR